jgi:hypothetical protein
MATAAWKSKTIALPDGVTVEVTASAEGVAITHSTDDGVLVGDMHVPDPDDASLLGCYVMQAAAECRVLRAQ